MRYGYLGQPNRFNAHGNERIFGGEGRGATHLLASTKMMSDRA